MERNSGSSTSSNRAHRVNSPTPRQRAFVLAYLTTGCAAEAARAAGYEGKYAAQAGYKLLRKRKGSLVHVERLQRFQRRLLRRDVLRAVRRIERLVEPKDAQRMVLERTISPLADALRALGLSDDPACYALAQRLKSKPPNWRRLYRLPWEKRTEGDAGELDQTNAA